MGLSSPGSLGVYMCAVCVCMYVCVHVCLVPVRMYSYYLYFVFYHSASLDSTTPEENWYPLDSKRQA